MARVGNSIGPENRLVVARGWGEALAATGRGWRVTAERYRVSFWGDRYGLKSIVVMVAQQCEYAKSP